MVELFHEKTSYLCLMLIICYGSLLLFENIVPKTMAYRKDGTSEIKEYLVENKRTRTTKQNYLLQRDLENNMLADNMDLVYPAASAKYERSPEELPALIVDYANMIRNDIILLDNSVETRTRKRGNIKFEEYSMDLNPPCTCNVENDVIEFNADYYPRVLKTVKCSEKLCPSPYKCEAVIYKYTVLKRKSNRHENSTVYIHDDLKKLWSAEVVPVTTSCLCQRDYTIKNN